MSTPNAAEVTAVDQPIEAIHVPIEAWIAAFVAMFIGYLLFSENGFLLTENWEMAHEFFHDGRHSFGVPCH